jgi:rubrerythrin
MDGEKEETLVASGQPCATAATPDACHRALRETATAGFGSSCHPAQCDFYLVVTDASGVHRLTSAAEIATFMAPIDTPGEAFLLAFANSHEVLACERPAAKKVGKNWQFTTNLMIEECPVVYADVTIGVSADGKVNVIRTANRRKTSVCVGRRPPGLRLTTGRAVSPVGTYLGQCAHLEAASVPAFERLERELEALGAPAGLSRLCQRAARDERRHARIMSRLARAYGARAPADELQATGARDAVTLAIDNAIEGCVRETFGALVGLYQASLARDVRVRYAMRSIARDEIRHAALSWKIAAWLEPRLSPRDKARVGRKRARAVSELRRESSVDPTADLCFTLGLPNGAVATRMVNALARTLWADRG